MKRYQQLVPVLLLCGCNVAPSLPNDVAANLLLQYTQHHCTAVPVFVSPGPEGDTDGTKAQQARAAIDWFNRAIANSADYSLVKREAENRGYVDQGRSGTIPGHYNYIFADKTTGCYVSMTGMDDGTLAPFMDAATITARLGDPSAVNILDITVDKETGKSADVVFTVATQPSLFARKAADGLSSLSQYQPGAVMPNPTRQYHAHLQKLDATGWQIASTDFFQSAPPAS